MHRERDEGQASHSELARPQKQQRQAGSHTSTHDLTVLTSPRQQALLSTSFNRVRDRSLKTKIQSTNSIGTSCNQIAATGNQKLKKNNVLQESTGPKLN